MATPLRLRGQDISVRILLNGDNTNVIEVGGTGSLNYSVDNEIKEDEFLGEPGKRYDTIFQGFSGDLEFQVATSNYLDLENATISKGRRESFPVFNVVVTEIFPSTGESVTHTYQDVQFGPVPTTVGSRSDYAKKKLNFKCSKRDSIRNAFV